MTVLMEQIRAISRKAFDCYELIGCVAMVLVTGEGHQLILTTPPRSQSASLLCYLGRGETNPLSMDDILDQSLPLSLNQ